MKPSLSLLFLPILVHFTLCASEKCGLNEFYTNCASKCGDSCSTLNMTCNAVCEAHKICVCITDFARYDGKCIPKESCPKLMKNKA